MARIAIFIDGGYIDKVVQNEFGNAKISYELLSREIARQIDPEATILRTYYYHCPPYQSNPPTVDESARYSSTMNFFDAINRLPRFEVRLGRLARRGPDTNGRYSFEQKMVDVLMSVDLVHLTAKGHVSDVAIVAGDSDFVPAVKTAKEEGVSIWLFHRERPHNDLWTVADERIRITQGLVDKVRMP
jgi:uncharacterized LabA/DUF88 family protein